MSPFEAILLGVLQGVTEFLPISSSGHLELAEYLLSLDQPGRLFDIVLHVGTLAAIVAYYRRDVAQIATDAGAGLSDAVGGAPARALERTGVRLGLLVALASVPTALIGASFDQWVDIGEGSSAAAFVCGALLLNGCVLFAGRCLDRPEGTEADARLSLWNITPSTALLVGSAQGLAVTPGLSRSGLTIIAALALGTVRNRAARFSFLVSIPAIVGALALEFEPDVLSGASYSGAVLAGGALTATGVGYASLIALVRLVRRAQFHHFSWYCWGLGLTGLILLAV